MADKDWHPLPDAWRAERGILTPEVLARIRAAFTPEEWEAMYSQGPGFRYLEYRSPIEGRWFEIPDTDKL